MNQKHSSDFVVIKAVEDGVNVIGLTREQTQSFTIPKNSTREK